MRLPKTLPLAYLPLYICLPSMSVPIAHFFGGNVDRDAINLCGSVVLCSIGACACLVIPAERRLNRHLMLLVLWLTLSLAAGLCEAPSSSNVLFYAQTVLPLFAIWYGYGLIRRPGDLSGFIRVSVMSTNVVVICLYAIALGKYGPAMLFSDRLQVMYELEYGIPQFKSYYPVCVQFTFSLALAQYLFGDARYRAAMLRSLVIHASFLTLCWSRAGLLGFGLTVAVQAAFAMAVGNRLVRQQMVLLAAVLLLVVGCLATGFGTAVGSREDVQEIDNLSDERRVDLFLEGLDRCIERPLFGDSFVPAWDAREGGLVVDVERLFGSHNQYVDMMLRGGVVYLFLFLLLLYRAIRCGFALALVPRQPGSQEFVVLGTAGTAFLLAVLVESNFQLYFIQLITAVPCMMLVGILYRARRLISVPAYRAAASRHALMESASAATPPFHAPTRRVRS